MLRRLHALYLRYAAVHEHRLSGVVLGVGGQRVGQVERIVRRDDRIEITGWANAKRLRVTWPGGAVEMFANIYRSDVAACANIAPDAGFEGAVPASAYPLKLQVEQACGSVFSVTLPHPGHGARGRAHRRVRHAFVRDLTRAMPALIRHLWAPSLRSKTAVKRALGLEVATRGTVIDPQWLTPDQATSCPVPRPASCPKAEITIVLPIFNALAYLQNCLARVAAGTDVPWHLIAVNDASTDPDLAPWLEAWAAARPGQVTLLSLPRNLGFVGAVNAGFEMLEQIGNTGPVVLLNTDAVVPDGWASRLIAPLADPGVASVTPMSNAAEVLSVPTIGPGIALGAGDVDAIDTVARSFGGAACPDVPTGVGFCMALSRLWLVRVPRLDPAFGRGYGEEVDWSQKTKALGARHLCQPRLFVEHVGGQSFGSVEKARQLHLSNALISSRYPVFDANVQRFIAQDPLATPRLALGVMLAARRAGRLPVFLAHGLGGGAEIALQMEIAKTGAAVVLRVGGPRAWQVEVQVDGQVMAGQTDDLAVVAQLLAPVPALDLIYSCGVGAADPVMLPKALLTLQRATHDDRIAVRLHDFFTASPSYTLLQSGDFLGMPDRDNIHPDHTSIRADGTPVSLAQWRDAWGALVAAADEVTAFSPSSAALFHRAYPDAPLVLRPHRLPTPVRALGQGAGQVIGVLGNMNAQKGALVLRDIALRMPAQTFVVIGNADSAISLPRNVVLHGPYQPPEIADLAERYGVCGWLVPAIWPETFSFTTHEALATGLPVAGFALGAQGEALARAPNGIAVALPPQETSAARLISALHEWTMHQEAAQ